jgi:hypothetical protein
MSHLQYRTCREDARRVLIGGSRREIGIALDPPAEFQRRGPAPAPLIIDNDGH